MIEAAGAGAAGATAGAVCGVRRRWTGNPASRAHACAFGHRQRKHIPPVVSTGPKRPGLTHARARVHHSASTIEAAGADVAVDAASAVRGARHR